MPRLANYLAMGALGALMLAPAFSVPASAEEVVLNVWSRQDVSGPLRGGNLITAASRLNKALEKEGSDTRVTVLVRQGPASGFDDDALQLLKVFGIEDLTMNLTRAAAYGQKRTLFSPDFRRTERPLSGKADIES